MEKEKMMIYENVKMLDAILGDLKQYTQKLELMKKAYEGLQIGELNNDVFEELKAKGANKILFLYDSSVKEQLDNAGIKNKAIRERMITDAQIPKNDFIEALQALKSVTIEPYQFAPHRNKKLALEDIVFKHGVFKIGNIEEITENHCRVYLNDQEDKEIHTTLIKLENALNEFSLMAKTKQDIKISILNTGIDAFFQIEEGEFKLQPYSIQYAKTFKSIQRAKQEAERNRIDRQSEINRNQQIKAGILVE